MPETTSPELDLLAARVARLERHNRWLRTAISGAAVLLASAVTVAWSSGPTDPTIHRGPRDEVRATRFVLVDGSDAVRAELRTDERGNPSLAMKNAAGAERIELYCTAQEAFVVLRDADGRTRLGLGDDRHGSPHVILSDANEKPRVHGSVNADGHGNLMFLDADGRIPAGLGVSQGKAWLRPAKGVEPQWPGRDAGAATGGTGKEHAVPPPTERKR